LNVDDADADATNEIQTITKAGSTVTLSNGGGAFTDNVNDADADVTNELQTITKSGNTVTLSDGGGSFDITDTVGPKIFAAGKVAADGSGPTPLGATVIRLNVGDYQVTFSIPAADANYIINLSQIDMQGTGLDDPGITYYDQTATGFKVNIGDNDNGSGDRTDFDGEFMFSIITF